MDSPHAFNAEYIENRTTFKYIDARIYPNTLFVDGSLTMSFMDDPIPGRYLWMAPIPGRYLWTPPMHSMLNTLKIARPLSI